MRRSSEREEFLADIITCAIEGGIGYWSQCSQYQVVDDDAVRVIVGPQVGDLPRAVIHVADENGGYEEAHLTITIETIARGLALVNGGAMCNTRLTALIRAADREKDGGNIDSEAADVIVQAGLFGEVVYG